MIPYVFFSKYVLFNEEKSLEPYVKNSINDVLNIHNLNNIPKVDVYRSGLKYEDDD